MKKILALFSLVSVGPVLAQTPVMLDGTSGTNSISIAYNTLSTSGGLSLNMGFFVDYLVVGGGGGGGGAKGANAGGGGGAQVVFANGVNLAKQNNTITGGAGGAGGIGTSTSAATVGGVGGSSSFVGTGLNVTAQGGGGGAGSLGHTGGGVVVANATTNGASGGGGSAQADPSVLGAPGPGTAGLGSAGGAGIGHSTSAASQAGGGGGGAGSAGSAGTGSSGGVGGRGVTNSITGLAVVYGGGGGGGKRTSGSAGSGGQGGGGAGGLDASGTAGTANTGGGGGGAADLSGSTRSGGAGGSGVVVVRYQGSSVGNVGGTVTSGTGTAAGYTLHSFNSTGSSGFNLSGVDLSSRLGATLTGVISGDGAVTFNGPGTLMTKAVNTYTGSTTVAGGTLIVDTGASIVSSSATSVGAGAHLKVNGAAGAVNVNGTLSGSGTVGAMTLNSGATLAVGNSPGLMTAASATWNAGSTFQFEINNATGTAATDWDLLSVTGALNLTSISTASKMNLTVLSTALQNYNTETLYSWVFAKAASLTGTQSWTAGLDVTDRFAIDSSGFNGGTQPGRGFKVVTGTDGGLATLSLQAVPEPSSGVLLVAGLAALAVMRRRRAS